MPTLTLTARRRVTFSSETCKMLGLKPGDHFDLEPRAEASGRFWVLRPRPSRARLWIGTLAHYAADTSDHSLKAVRASIAVGRQREPAARVR